MIGQDSFAVRFPFVDSLRLRLSPVDGWAAARAVRFVWATIIVAVIGVIVGLVTLWPGHTSLNDPALVGGEQPIAAHVTSSRVTACSTSTVTNPQECVVSELHVAATPTSVPPRGAGAPAVTSPTLEQPYDANSPRLHTGDDINVIASRLPDGSIAYTFYDYRRSGSLLLLAGLFALIVIAVGRWRGLGALLGMAISLAVLVTFLLPALLAGRDPVAVAVVGAATIAFFALFLAQGVKLTTAIALLGTFAGLAITLGLSWVFVRAADLTGLTDESASFLSALNGRIDVRGVLLAGFVIGSLGVLDDITVTQVSAVSELRATQPSIGHRALFRAANNIGRDHIASTVNTLVLAYAGAALPLLLLFTGAHQSVTSIVSREVVATEVVRSLVGSIGLVAAVPITTWLAVHVAKPADQAPRWVSDAPSLCSPVRDRG